MGNFLKNVFVSAAFVVVGTMATSGVAAVAAVFFSAEAAGPMTGEYAFYGAYAAAIMGALFGFLFSMVTLFIAAISMPPALGLIRAFKLPRPLFDMLGGGAAALICTAIAMSLIESLVRAKGGSMPEDDARLIIDICAMIGGAATAYIRYAVLAPKTQAPTAPIAPQWQAEGGG